MNPDYRDKLTDLGISDNVVEEIQKLNKDYLQGSFGHSYNQFEGMSVQRDNDLDHYANFQFYYLQTEGFIK